MSIGVQQLHGKVTPPNLTRSECWEAHLHGCQIGWNGFICAGTMPLLTWLGLLAYVDTGHQWIDVRANMALTRGVHSRPIWTRLNMTHPCVTAPSAKGLVGCSGISCVLLPHWKSETWQCCLALGIDYKAGWMEFEILWKVKRKCV